MRKIILLLMLTLAGYAFVQAQEQPTAPFAGYNTTWINGQNRQTEFPLTLNDAKNRPILTAMAYIDTYYSYDLKGPKDNTHVSSASIGRDNEFTLNMATIGVESYYNHSIGRIWLQAGNMLNLIQDTDGSTSRGRNSSVSNLKYIREAAAGYHFDLLHGINVEMGIFSSFIGMDSYLTQENWSYQRAMINELVPSYLSGIRLQFFPSCKFRNEIWLVNGWQSYGQWSNIHGVGSSNLWRPNENIQLAASAYVGKDTREELYRFHHDNSIALRYHNQPISNGMSQAAFALNTHYGFQWGSEITPSEQYIFGLAAMNRIWFTKNRIGVTLRYDYLINSGLYLASAPTIIKPNPFYEAARLMCKPTLQISQLTATLDLMPNNFTTMRVEFGYRTSNLPYFAGQGGTTSPDGWTDTPTSGWTPDLSKRERRITIAASFRL